MRVGYPIKICWFLCFQDSLPPNCKQNHPPYFNKLTSLYPSPMFISFSSSHVIFYFFEVLSAESDKNVHPILRPLSLSQLLTQLCIYILLVGFCKLLMCTDLVGCYLVMFFYEYAISGSGFIDDLNCLCRCLLNQGMLLESSTRNYFL